MEDAIKKNMLKTGTSILGIVCKDGIIMAADRQVTAGMTVMFKNKEKVLKINDYLVFSGCGLAAASDRIKKVLPAELKLKELRSKSRPTVKQSANLLAEIIYHNIRQPSMVPDEVGALIAGFNEDGTTELYSIDPAGSIKRIEDFDTNFGSGMPYMLGLLERQYKKDLTIKEGVELAIEALKSSTQRDIGSGYGLDIFTITKDGIKHEVKQKIESNFKDEKS